jgi:hypothetical protein
LKVYKSGVHQSSLLTLLGPYKEKPFKKLKTIAPEVTVNEDSDQDEFKDAYSDEEEIKEDIKKSLE